MTESFKLQTVAGHVSIVFSTQDIYIYSRRESDVALSSRWFGWGLRWGIVYLKKLLFMLVALITGYCHLTIYRYLLFCPQPVVIISTLVSLVHCHY